MADPTALPLYVRISEMLIRDIAAGRLMVGERLAPEREMAAELGVSVGTLRRALGVLGDKGLLERIQGSGNYIKNTEEATGVYAFFRLELLEGGGLPTAEVIAVDLMDKPAHLPAFGTGPRAHRIRRLRRLGGESAALEEIWLDAGYAPRLRAEALSESLYHYYQSRLGLFIQRVEDRIGVGRLPGWGAGRMAVAPGAPCGLAERIGWDAEGRRAEVSQSWFDSDRARYVARLR